MLLAKLLIKVCNAAVGLLSQKLCTEAALRVLEMVPAPARLAFFSCFSASES